PARSSEGPSPLCSLPLSAGRFRQGAEGGTPCAPHTSSRSVGRTGSSLEPSRAGPCTFRDSVCAYTAAAVITDTAVQIAVGSSWPRRRRTRQRQQLSHRGVHMDRRHV